MNKAFYQTIAARLESQAAQDDTFREKFSARMMTDKNSITQCCSYIIQQVKNSKRTETIELSLKSRKILQCRAKNNGISARHEDILSLMEQNIQKYCNAVV